MSKRLIVGMITLAACLALFSEARAVDVKGYDLEIILDSSGSMAQNLGGKTKMAVAKEAIQSVVNEVPGSTFMGFRAYGHQSGTAEKNCTDTQLIVPIGAINKSDFMAKVNALQPRGWTPIDYSLRQAQNDFTNKSEYGKMIILVSDGEETCGGDPCQAVKDLKAAGFNPIVNTVGFDVDDKTEAQLRCIAEATGGEYKSARSASELIESMRIFSKRAFQTYTPSGTVVPGTGFGNAPLVTPGIYGGDILIDESKFYKFNIKKGQKVTSSLSIKREKGLDFFYADMSPSVKLYNGNLEIVAEIKGQYSKGNISYITSSDPDKDKKLYISSNDTSPKSYSASFTSDKSQEMYVAVSNNWRAESNYKEDEAQKAKYNKAFYDVKITIEGAGEAEPVATAGKSGANSTNTADKDSSLLDGDSSDDAAASGTKNKTLMYALIAGVVILFLGGGAAVVIYMLRQRNAGAGNIVLAENSVPQPDRMPQAPIRQEASPGADGKFCTQCGAKNGPDKVFCTSCGGKL